MHYEDSHYKLFLISSILRDRVFSSIYWKSECFGLDSETILDKAICLDYIGTTYGGDRKATPFLCLLVKLLQIKPTVEIVQEYINNPKFKYLTALGILYLRLTASSIILHNSIEHLYQDYRKLKIRNLDGSFNLIHIDELVEICLRSRKFLDLDLPYIHKRSILVKNGLLKFPRESKIEFDPSQYITSLSKNETKRRKSLSRSISPCSTYREGFNDLDTNKSPIKTINSHSKEVNLSIEQWNIYRQKLGLKPLR